jgi:hypothetical protein
MEPFVVNLGKRGGTVNSKIGAVNVLPIWLYFIFCYTNNLYINTYMINA